jgi:hypothetical protein
MALEVIVQASCCTHKEFKGGNGTENLVANIEQGRSAISLRYCKKAEMNEILHETLPL